MEGLSSAKISFYDQQQQVSISQNRTMTVTKALKFGQVSGLLEPAVWASVHVRSQISCGSDSVSLNLQCAAPRLAGPGPGHGHSPLKRADCCSRGGNLRMASDSDDLTARSHSPLQPFRTLPDAKPSPIGGKSG
jgi:hypothetical protein